MTAGRSGIAGSRDPEGWEVGMREWTPTAAPASAIRRTLRATLGCATAGAARRRGRTERASRIVIGRRRRGSDRYARPSPSTPEIPIERISIPEREEQSRRPSPQGHSRVHDGRRRSATGPEGASLEDRDRMRSTRSIRSERTRSRRCRGRSRPLRMLRRGPSAPGPSRCGRRARRRFRATCA